MKRTPESKRARLPRASDYSKPFIKDWERFSRSGRYDLRLAKELMLLLMAADEPLGAEWRDHPLKGKWEGYRECHVGGDFLLIYRLKEGSGPVGEIVFVRLGTHAELFNE